MTALFVAALAQAPTLHLPAFFSDNMVLQRDMQVPFFGTAAPGTSISVSLNGHHAETKAKADGTWMVKLRPMKAGGPYTATISGDGTVELRNVMIGEVWVCSGQSNMELHVGEANESQLAQNEADPAVRMFTVTRSSTEQPVSDVNGSWVVAKPDTVLQFSAAGYWFGSEIHKRLNVPVGLIFSAWGGTPAEAWTSRQTMLDSAAFGPYVRSYLASLKDFPKRKADYDRDMAAWKASVYHTDDGNDGFGMGYADPDFNTSTWHPCTLPNLLEVTENRIMDGAVWYRRDIDIPAEWAGKTLNLSLGTISDFDITYFNGRRVGGIDDKTPYWQSVDRVYPVPPALIHPGGKNTIAVRVFNQYARGGFTGGAAVMKIGPADGSAPSIPLAGPWISKIEKYMEQASDEVVHSQPETPFGPGHPWAPGGLYNAMINPLIPYAIRGTIWYQGEANVDRAYAYRELFPMMITDWRQHWGQGDFPFYFVQLPLYTPRQENPGESNWAELREAQAMTLKLPNTGMAVTLDLGEANDIHPKNKREVGHRLAMIAMQKTYGEDLITSGPVMKQVSFNGNQARVDFDAHGPLKSVDGGAIGGFTIAGPDHKFYWGTATIQGNSVVVTCPYVSQATAIRYAWANNPYVNLSDDSNLPAAPFRTDNWPGITAPK